MAKYNSRLSVLKFYIPSSIRGHLYLLFVSCLISASFSFLLIYSNIQNIGLFFTSLFVPISFNPALSKPADPNAGRKAGLSVYDQNIIYNDFDYLNNSTLTFEKRIYSTDIQVLYRLPKKVPIFALLLIFHGCSRSANDWFTTIERQRIVGAAVDLGYGCLAFQSTDQLSHCWSSESELSQNPDVQMVWNGLDGFYKEHPTLKSLPRFTFGASSGGIFSSVFATNSRDKIQGQIIFISIVLPDVLETHVKKGNYPPTAWIYMTRDTEFASEARINESMKIFAQHNIPHISFAITPIPITATIFHERIPTITKETSKHIAYLLQSNNWLDAHTYLRYNPRRRNTWRDFISLTSNKTSISTSIFGNLNDHQNVLPDFFNTLYGEHEISFERSFEALQWHQRISKLKQNLTS